MVGHNEFGDHSMRLTLRTLLAYLDDILEPAEAREIGQKLQESSVASSLVSRIREVVRRRRLTAPTVSGSGMGIDPNLVAEYLDNTLAPEGIADVEKICLESDVHLAEVAACHQVLTLALGEPVEIHPETRERMYALGPNSPHMHFEAPVAVLNERSTKAASNGERTPAQAEKEVEQRAAREAAAAVAVPETVPSYRRPKSFWSRALVPAALACGLIGWGILAFQNSPFWGGRPEGSGPAPETVAMHAGPDKAAVAAPPVHEHEAEKTEPAPTEVAAATPRTTGQPSTEIARSEPVKVPSIDLPPPPDAPELATPKKPFVRDASKAAPGEKTETPASDTTVAVRPAVPATPPVPAPAAIPTVGVKYESIEGVVLHYSFRDQKWLMLPRRAVVHPGDQLAVPEPFDCRLDLDEGRAQVTFQSRTVARILPPGELSEFAVGLARGQMVIRPGVSGGPNAKEPIHYSLGIRGEIWRLEIGQPDTVVGVEVDLLEPSRFETPSDAKFGGAVYVASGSARLVDPAGHERTLKGPTWFPLPVPVAEGKTDMPREVVESAVLQTVPKWLTGAALSSTEKQYKTLFERRFDPGEDIVMSIPAVAADPNPAIARLATECLALIDAIDPLISVLQRSTHEECRKAAILGLRAWLPLAEENRETLKSELAMRYPPAEADAVYQLLWGYNQDDARDPATSRKLIDWMGDAEASIRELAFYHVFRLTDKRHDYRPNATTLQLQSSLNRWRQHLVKEGALLPPKPAEPTP
jgi:hypothetical protein